MFDTTVALQSTVKAAWRKGAEAELAAGGSGNSMLPLARGDPMVMRSSFKGHYEADSASLFGFGRHSQTDNVFGRTP
jgi:hypothetical protein